MTRTLANDGGASSGSSSGGDGGSIVGGVVTGNLAVTGNVAAANLAVTGVLVSGVSVTGSALVTGNLRAVANAFVAVHQTPTVANVGINTGGTLPQASLHVVGNVIVGAGSINMAIDNGPLVEAGGPGGANRFGIGGFSGFTTRVYTGTAVGTIRLCQATGTATYTDLLVANSWGVTTAATSNLVVASNAFVVLRVGAGLANVGVNTLAPQVALHVVGNVRVDGAIYATGDITALSDATVKSNLALIGEPVTRVQGLAGYTYTKDGGRTAGLVAQDVLRVLPEASGMQGNLYTIAYSGVTALLVEAVKDLARRVEALESRVL